MPNDLVALVARSMQQHPAFARRLRRDQFLRFQHPRQLCVRAERGTLWITVDGEPADIQLEAGTSRIFDAGPAIMVGAMGRDAAVSVTPLGQPAWRERLARLLWNAVARLAGRGPARHSPFAA